MGRVRDLFCIFRVMGSENTPPASPGITPVDDDGDEMYEDDVAEEVEVGEGEAEVRMVLLFSCCRYLCFYHRSCYSWMT